MELSGAHCAIAIFDLDNTLIGGDSDHTWGQFLVTEGVVDRNWYEHQNDRFYRDYKQGTLDIDAFLDFALQPLSEHSYDDLVTLRDRFMARCIEPMILPKALALVEQHRDSGHQLLIITATNRFVTELIAKRYGITELLATEPEMQDGRFTGRVAGVPCFQAGKIHRFHDWLSARNINAAETWFYSDSHNDLPLLNEVDNPVAVDPDQTLSDIAKQRNWPQISLR